MTQIREVIENLCVVLHYHGISELSPEIFRIAKFDNPEATKPLWNSLRNTLIWLETTDLRHSKSHSSGESEGIVRFCKHEMFTKGYRVRAFFALPSNMAFGSREVLLSIGWLMAKEKMIKKFINQVQPSITENLPGIDNLSCRGIKTTDISDPRKTAFKPLDELLVNTIQETVLLKGKLHSACRSLLAAKNEYATILKTIHSVTIPFPVKPTSSHLSALDVYLLFNPNDLNSYQEKLEIENHYLHSLLVVKANENLFWKWLESALDLRDKDICENSDDIEQDEYLKMNQENYRPSKQTQYIKTKQVDLSKHLQDRENIYQCVSTKWKRYRNVVEKTKGMQEQFDALLECLDQEVLKELEKVNSLENKVLTEGSFLHSSLSSLCGTLKLLTPLVTQPKKDKRPSFDNEPSMLHRYIKQLQQNDQVLKTQLKKLQNENNNKITKVALTMDDMVCIPPK